jgi:hypothetical protein
MPLTYEPIATTTLGSDTSVITFNSIPGTYTDLKLVLILRTTFSSNRCQITLNNDTSTNYSRTLLFGTGTSASTSLSSTGPNWNMGQNFLLPTPGSGIWNFQTFDIFNYAGSTFKTALSTYNEDENGSGEIDMQVNLYRSTSAITRIDATPSVNPFTTGSSATLYGIKAA